MTPDNILLAIVIIVIVVFGFYLGTLVGEDHQAAKDQNVFDSYNKIINEKEHELRNLKLKHREDQTDDQK